MATSKTSKYKGYSDYRTLIQCFAVFKEINSRWMSVTQRRRLYCNRKRIVELFFGDCDDHSILMAASVRAIGGTPRLIHTKGHIYPEILIGT
jgi:transglutaminase-like putative cysteine protease